jgi:pimeloyl-ACP methyl ester carboxylesterase
MKLAQKIAIRYVRARLRMIALVSKKKAAKKALKLFSTPMRRAKVRTPPVFDKGENLSFKLENHTIRGHRWIPQTAPLKKILILHGFESSSKKFSSYISAFIKKGYEVLAFDAPAHGESGGKEINLPLYVRMIDEIYKRYGPIQSFLAHSFGGLAISHFLETVPHDAETKIALVAPATETKTSIDIFFQFLGLDEEVRKEFDAMIVERTGKPPTYFSVRRAMHHISASVLWVHDEEDDITPISDVRKVLEDNPRKVKFIFTKGLGHRKIYRDDKVMKSVVEFL